MPEYVEPVGTLCGNVVDFGILGILCFEVYHMLKCEKLCKRIGKEHWILFVLYEICRFLNFL